jgi:hypothetical protein
MESINKEITFLKKPSLNPNNLSYLTGKTSDIYVNLFKLSSTQDLVMYVYSVSFLPEIDYENSRMKKALFNVIQSDVKSVYSNCIYSGDNLYAMNEVTEPQEFHFTNPKNDLKYTLRILKTEEKVLMTENNIDKPVVKTIYELMIKEILHANPDLDFYKNLFVFKDIKKKISSKNNEIDFFPGYSTAIHQTSKGIFLNVSIKNKLLSTKSCLDIISTKFKDKMKTSDGKKEIREYFQGKQIKTTYTKKTYIIDDICFDKNPTNTTFKKDGSTILVANYYKVAHNIIINDKTQPLFVVNRLDKSTGNTIPLYFVPELCLLAGIDDSVVKDGLFMKELAKETKLTPPERVSKTNDFLKLLDDKKIKEVKNKDGRLLYKYKHSAADLKKAYKLQIFPADKNDFLSQYMKVPNVVGSAKNSNTY